MFNKFIQPPLPIYVKDGFDFDLKYNLITPDGKISELGLLIADTRFDVMDALSLLYAYNYDIEIFDHSKIKDSKKFHSEKKIQEVAEYIKKHAVAWAVEYEDEQVIDDINILQATQSAMHKAIRSVLKQLKGLDTNNLFLLIDGNYFKPLTICNKNNNRIENAKFLTFEGGDNKYTAIAAASILAKVERDKYIEDLCLENPELIERYGIDSNKGYGSKKHMDGIKQYGITKWHRRSFGICKMFS